MASSSVTVDIHTHLYPPSYMSILKSRETVPYVRTSPEIDIGRLIILPGEDDQSKPPMSRGRPIGPDFWDIKRKISFMDKHKIDVSVISLANPWLDFIPKDEAAEMARRVNDDMNDLCSQYPKRLYAFGTLPLSGSVDVVVAEVKRLKTLKFMRGVIMGSSGFGQGLDDPKLDPVWKALDETGTHVFIHPHYGLPSEVYGPRGNEYGHVLPLALGFPLETTIAVTRMYLSGVWDRAPGLQVILAHSGGTLPFLAGRIESCIAHDRTYGRSGIARRDLWDVLNKNVHLDAVIYSNVGLAATLEVDDSSYSRTMFGTDHPFFPPVDNEDEEWLSVSLNVEAVDKLTKKRVGGSSEKDLIMGGNAVKTLGLEV